MELRMLSLNCQRGYQPGLRDFLSRTLSVGAYDFLALQEVDKKVLAFLQQDSYALLRDFSPEANEEAELCIVYRRSFELLDHGYSSFAAMRNDPWRGFKHPSFGFLYGMFGVAGEKIRIGSIHLHSGIDRKARHAELALAKKSLLALEHISTILTGDTNAGYPGESKAMAKLLAPDFSWATKHLGPTLDSRYSENVPHLPNRIAAFLSLFNIKIPLWTDQAFIDSISFASNDISCRILPDRVSDHSPVEITIRPRQEARDDRSQTPLSQHVERSTNAE